MRWVWVWIALICLVTTAQVSAGDGEQLARDQLPPELTKRLREAFDAELLHARKVVEGDKACYLVTATCKDEVIELYAAPDGTAFIRKTEAFSLTRWTQMLVGGALYLLLPLMVVGALTRVVVRASRGGPLSVPAGWLSAWAGAGVGMGLVVFNLATVPREKDVVVLVAYCVVWGAIAASILEIVTLAVSSGRADGTRHLWVIGFSVVAAVLLALTIPLDHLRIERENNYFKKLTLRPQAG